MPSLEDKSNDTGSMDLLTQKELKYFLKYNPETGIFTWNVGVGNILKGTGAGSAASNGYLTITIRQKAYRAHRLAFLYMTGTFPVHEIDHINMKRADNRWKNLRDVTRSENHRNRDLSITNTSGTTGVSWDKVNKKWMAHIKVHGKMKNLGRFKNKNEAIEKRKLAESKLKFHPNHGRR